MFGFGKKKRQQQPEESTPMATGPVIAMVTLPKVVPLRAFDVVQFLQELNGIELGAGESNDDGSTFAADVSGGGILALAVMPGPIPWSDLEGPCATAWYWPEATEVIRPHQAHVIVTLVGGEEDKDPIERALLVTRAAAAVAELHNATGVYWGAGTVIQSASDFIEISQGASRESLPLPAWMEVRYVPNKRGAKVFTTGLESLGHKEFEIHGTTKEPGDVIPMIYDVAHYVLMQGPVLKHGETFGPTADERYKIRHGPSMHAERGGVIILGM